ncbi:MAG: hypothetical protein HMLKMBBP_01231 [Planctomycetes bacterium]|nr:hypothetical protein [Planctomycetota bacterium]
MSRVRAPGNPIRDRLMERLARAEREAPATRRKVSPRPDVARPRCGRCRRPQSACWCRFITPIAARTRVVILQHPREHDVAIGTARMAALAIEGAELHLGLAWEGTEALRSAVSDPARPPVLLFPGDGARDVGTDPPQGPVTLVVIDGTWSQAKRMVRQSPTLASLPRVSFVAPRPSNYRIRKEPRADYVSTVEALVYVLGALEGDADAFRPLLVPFDAMVDGHLEKQRERAVLPRYVRPRKRPAGSPRAGRDA